MNEITISLAAMLDSMSAWRCSARAQSPTTAHFVVMCAFRNPSGCCPAFEGDYMKAEKTPDGTAILTDCPDCHGEMKIERVDPHPHFGDKGFETHTFKCSSCSRLKTYMMDPRTPDGLAKSDT